MTEEEWLDCGERLADMFDHVQPVLPEGLFRRKLVAAVAGWGRQVGRVLYDDLAIRAFQLLERGLDGSLFRSELDTLGFDLRDAVSWRTPVPRGVLSILFPDRAGDGPVTEAIDISDAISQYLSRSDQADIIRDVFGNPFRPVAVAPARLTPTVLSLAQGIYADRAFDRLPILADALHDAGCDNDDLLTHLRGSDPHVKGCWALDLVLGKA